jgi:hypothetical protein
LRADFQQSVETAMQGVRLPPAAQLTGYRVVTGSGEPLRVVVCYLGDRDIETDAQALVADHIRARFAIADAAVSYERIRSSFGPLVFKRHQAALPANAGALLDQIAQTLRQHPGLRAEIVMPAEPSEREKMAEERAQAISDYLRERGEIAAERIKTIASAEAGRSAVISLAMADKVK